MVFPQKSSITFTNYLNSRKIPSLSFIQKKSRICEYENIVHFRSFTAGRKMSPTSLKSPLCILSSVYVHLRFQVFTSHLY